jgi:hypothetical protein
MSAAEGPLVFKSNTEDKWYLFLDEFGGRGYVPFETTDLDSGKWTPSTGYTCPRAPARHGPAGHPGRVRPAAAAYQPDRWSSRSRTVASPPGSVTAAGAAGHRHRRVRDGVRRSASVTWDEVPAAAYARRAPSPCTAPWSDTAPGPPPTVTVQAEGSGARVALKLRYGSTRPPAAVARDSSGNGYDGTYAGRPTGAPGWRRRLVQDPVRRVQLLHDRPVRHHPERRLKGAQRHRLGTGRSGPVGTVNQWIYGSARTATSTCSAPVQRRQPALLGDHHGQLGRPSRRCRRLAALPGGSGSTSRSRSTARPDGDPVRERHQGGPATGVTVKPSDLYDATKATAATSASRCTRPTRTSPARSTTSASTTPRCRPPRSWN